MYMRKAIYQKILPHISIKERQGDCVIWQFTPGDLNDGKNFWQYTNEVFDAKTPDILFNRLRSGTWTAFLIELDNAGKVTGNYAEDQTVEFNETFTVKAGDVLLFHVDAEGGNNAYDGGRFNVDIAAVN